MTPQPTKEQIEAAYDQAHRLYNDVTFVDGDIDINAIATVIATARLEGEAKGRVQGLDEARKACRSLSGVDFNGVWGEYEHAVNDCEQAILALKEKP